MLLTEINYFPTTVAVATLSLLNFFSLCLLTVEICPMDSTRSSFLVRPHWAAWGTCMHVKGKQNEQSYSTPPSTHNYNARLHPFSLLLTVWQAHTSALVSQQEDREGQALCVFRVPPPRGGADCSGCNGWVLHVQAAHYSQGG